MQGVAVRAAGPGKGRRTSGLSDGQAREGKRNELNVRDVNRRVRRGASQDAKEELICRSIRIRGNVNRPARIRLSRRQVGEGDAEQTVAVYTENEGVLGAIA